MTVQQQVYGRNAKTHLLATTKRGYHTHATGGGPSLQPLRVAPATPVRFYEGPADREGLIVPSRTPKQTRAGCGMKTADRQVTDFLFPEMSASARIHALIEARHEENLAALAKQVADARATINRKAAQAFRRLREREGKR